MKKGMKGFVIGAGICIGVGVVVASIAAFAGGISNTKTLITDADLNVGFLKNLESMAMTKEKVISLSNVKNPKLDLDLSAGYFEIVETDGEDLIVNAADKINVTLDGDKIRVSTPKQYTFFHINLGNDSKRNKVRIAVPKGTVFDEISMDLGAGEMVCDTLNCDKIYVDLGAGKMTVDEVESRKASFYIGAGEITVDRGTAKEMDIDVGMGSFAFHGEVSDELEASCGMGNIQMWLDGKEEDHNYAVECGMGRVIVGQHSYTGVSTEQKIDNNAQSDYDLECGMGNIEIVFED